MVALHIDSCQHHQLVMVFVEQAHVESIETASVGIEGLVVILNKLLWEV